MERCLHVGIPKELTDLDLSTPPFVKQSLSSVSGDNKEILICLQRIEAILLSAEQTRFSSSGDLDLFEETLKRNLADLGVE